MFIYLDFRSQAFGNGNLIMEIGVRIYATIFVAFGIRQVDVVRRNRRANAGQKRRVRSHRRARQILSFSILFLGFRGANSRMTTDHYIDEGRSSFEMISSTCGPPLTEECRLLSRSRYQLIRWSIATER